MSRGEVYPSAFSGLVLAQQLSLVKKLIAETCFLKHAALDTRPCPSLQSHNARITP